MNSDPLAHLAERDYAAMQKNAHHLKLFAHADLNKVQAELVRSMLPELNAEQLTVLYDRPLGGGGFARVFEGIYQGERVAVKQVIKGMAPKLGEPDLTDDQRLHILAEEARREVAILYKLHPSPHTIGVRGFCVKDQKACVVMDPATKSLASKLIASAYAPMTWRNRMTLLRDIALGLVSLYEIRLEVASFL
ncbi:hypothetical protein HDV00_007324 [Rhizophlyctis rosea]|nr:hypothetical protein HDV00_007324 [Rhizophlyctis rosea]